MKLPEFVKFEHNGLSVYFRLTRRLNDRMVYYRDAGKWDMGWEWDNGILVAKTPWDSMCKNYWDGLELKPATRGEYTESNRGHLPEDWDNMTPVTDKKTEEKKKDDGTNGPTPDRDWNRILAEQARDANETSIARSAESGILGENGVEETDLDDTEDDDFEEFTEDETQEGDPVDKTGGVAEDEEPIFRVTKGEYFYIGDSKTEEFHFLRALKDFEIFDKGRTPWDLVSDLEFDGLVEILPDADNQDGLDFAYE